MTLPKILTQIISTLVSHYQPEKIILFGSAARGKMRKYSDLDIAIIKKTNKRFYDRIGDAIEATQDISPKPPIDFLVYTPEEIADMSQYNYFIRDEILKKGVVLYDQQNPAYSS